MRQTTNGNAIKVSGGKSNSPLPPSLLPPCPFVHIRLVPRLVISLPGAQVSPKELPSPPVTFLPFTSLSPSAGGQPSIPLFFPLNSSDTWPFSLPPRVFQGVESAHTHTHTFVSPSLNVSISLSGKERRVEERKSK